MKNRVATRLTVGGAVLLLAAGLAAPALAASPSMTPEEVIAAIEAEKLNGVSQMRGIAGEFAEDVEDADSAAEAEAIEDVEAAWKDSKTKIIQITFGHHSHPEVQQTFEDALETLEEVKEASIAAINELYAAAYAATTTTTTSTTLPSTNSTTAPGGSTATTTAPSVTTTTSPPATTTTTTAPAGAVPPDRPDKPESDLMAATPEASGVSAQSTSAEVGEETGVVGLVTRVVDSQLPDGVSAVATGPLVVLGLVIDAIRAAGVFMFIPWILLLGYMAVLLAVNRWKPAIAMTPAASK